MRRRPFALFPTRAGLARIVLHGRCDAIASQCSGEPESERTQRVLGIAARTWYTFKAFVCVLVTRPTLDTLDDALLVATWGGRYLDPDLGGEPVSMWRNVLVGAGTFTGWRYCIEDEASDVQWTLPLTNCSPT